MVLDGMGKRAQELICPIPGCGGKLRRIYGHVRCSICDYIARYHYDEQIAPETRKILGGLFGKRITRGKFVWDRPLRFAQVGDQIQQEGVIEGEGE